MSKAEFLKRLDDALSNLPKGERDKSVAFYDEIISDRMEDGMTEEEAVDSLGSVEEIARQIMRDTPVVPKFWGKIKSCPPWLVIVLAICGFPIWFSILAVICAGIISVFAGACGIILSLFLCVLAIGLAGIVGVVAFFYFLYLGQIPFALFLFGAGLICIALTMFSVMGTVLITKQLIRFLRWSALRIKGWFHKPREVTL